MMSGLFVCVDQCAYKRLDMYVGAFSFCFGVYVFIYHLRSKVS